MSDRAEQLINEVVSDEAESKDVELGGKAMGSLTDALATIKKLKGPKAKAALAAIEKALDAVDAVRGAE